MRRSYYFFPKLVFGKPTDVFIDYTSRIPLKGLAPGLYKLNLAITPCQPTPTGATG